MSFDRECSSPSRLDIDYHSGNVIPFVRENILIKGLCKISPWMVELSLRKAKQHWFLFEKLYLKISFISSRGG